MSKNLQKKIDVSIIIVSWNVRELLIDCIKSVKKYVNNLTYEIIIIDNGSSDDSVNTVRKNFPEIKLVANKENVGFGAANNQGVKIARGRYLVFLNPDTLLKYNIISNLIKTKEEVGAALIGPEQINGRGMVVYNCSKFRNKVMIMTLIENLLSKFIRREKRIIFKGLFHVPVLNAAFWLIDKLDFCDLGMFDEDIFLYYEELDMCTRISQEGGKVFLDRREYIIHYQGQSTRQVPNKKYFYTFYSFLCLIKSKIIK